MPVMRRACVLFVATASCALVACSNPIDERAAQQQQKGAQAAAGETASPKDAPTQYKVLLDDSNKQTNTAEYHVLVAAQPKHDEADALLKYLYRHLMTRAEPQPAGVAAYVYSDEAQFKTPPRSPIASVVQKPGDVGPAFDNKVPLEFWQQIDQAMLARRQGLEAREEGRAQRRATRRSPSPCRTPSRAKIAGPTSSRSIRPWSSSPTRPRSCSRRSPSCAPSTSSGRWKDQDVVKIGMDRTQYQAINIGDIEESIGQLHGRAFLELATNHGTEKSVEKGNTQRMAATYKKMLGQLKGHAWVSPTLK